MPLECRWCRIVEAIHESPQIVIDNQFLQIIQTGGDSNNRPTAMCSRSMARSQCWTTVSKRTGSFSAPDVNSTGNNQPTSGALSDPVLFDTVAQHWLLAIDCDRIAVGLSFESPPACTFCKNLIININLWRLVYRLTIRHQRHAHSIIQYR